MRVSGVAALVVMMTSMAVGAAHATTAIEGAEDRSPWRLVWSDEFDGDALDPAKWRARVTPAYHPLGATDFSADRRHLRVEDGVLKLVARRAPHGRFASAMVETQHIAAWRHGRFEARIRVPRGKGTNAAFWMMHRDPTGERWPLGGEIDIVEQLGRQPNRAYGTVHFRGSDRIGNGGRLDIAEPFGRDFHVFAVEWTEAGMAWFVDGRKYHEVTNMPPSHAERPHYPFDRPYFAMLSNVIGGKWPGRPGFFSTWPKTMEIDWVRVYQREGDAMAQGPQPRDPATR